MGAFDWIAPASAVFVIVVGIFGYGWLKIIKETNNLLKEQNAELKIANKELLEKHNENIVRLSSMQGQIDVLKSIPLVNIDTTLKELSRFNKTLSETNAKILHTLEHSATVLQKDTADAKSAAKAVKLDLAQSNQ